METYTTDERKCVWYLSAHDPVLRLLLYISNHNPIVVYVVALLAHLLLETGVGLYIGRTVPGAFHTYLPITEPSGLIFSLFNSLIATPFAWTWFVSEPLFYQKMLLRLKQNNVLVASTQSSETFDSFVVKRAREYVRWRYLAISVGFMFAVTAIWVWQQRNPADPFNFGYRQFWFTLSPFYFWGIFVPLNLGPAYMIMWTIIRRFLALVTINKMMTSFDIRPVLLHPDGCNGLQPIGTYILQITPLVTAASIWEFVALALPVFLGQSVNLKPDTILYIMVWVFFIPVVLILPAWSTHVAMRQLKWDALLNVARDVQNVLSGIGVTGGSTASAQTASLALLEPTLKTYQLLLEKQRTWPFKLPVLQRSIITAVIPVASTLLSILFQGLVKAVVKSVVP